MNLNLRKFLAIAFLAAAAGTSHACRAEGPPEFRTSNLQIAGADGGRHAFTVEIADSEALRQRGLMFRKSLPADHGMLLLYDKPRPVAIWMKDTPLALDILFINERNRIVSIAADAMPMSLTIMSSMVPVRAVLEIAAGQAKKQGIRVGDSVVFPDGD